MTIIQAALLSLTLGLALGALGHSFIVGDFRLMFGMFIGACFWAFIGPILGRYIQIRNPWERRRWK